MKKVTFFTWIVITLSITTNAQTEATLTQTDKIFGLSTIWKDASYNFAFFDQVPQLNWDSCYQAFIPKVAETKTDWEYYRLLENFMAQLQDGHTRIFPPAKLRNKYFGTATLKLETRLIENKVIVTKVLDKELTKQGLKAGMEILKVDNLDVRKYAENYIKPYAYASTQQDINVQVYGYFLLSGSVSQPAVISVKDFKGKIKSYSIDRQPWLLEEEAFKGNPMSYKLLDNNIGYLKIYNFVDTKEFRPKFDSIYQKILKTKGLIIDVRGNLGGSTQITYYVLKHLTNKKFRTEKWKSPMHVAAHKAWHCNNDWYESEGKDIEPFQDRPIYLKPVNVLADEGSFSGAEDFCLGFLTLKRGKLIGRKTAGSSGSPLIFNLPIGGMVLICTKKDFFPDGKEFIGYGIEPDITVDLTVDDIKNDIDRVLKVAVKNL